MILSADRSFRNKKKNRDRNRLEYVQEYIFEVRIHVQDKSPTEARI